MMRRTRLVSRTRLRAFTPLVRRAPLTAAAVLAPARRKPAVPGLVRDALAERSAGWCEIRLPGCWGVATDPHHRVTVKAGGRRGEAKARHDRLSNLLHCCRRCHDLVTSPPAGLRAYDHGWCLREGEVSSRAPVFRCGEWVYLADNGAVREVTR